METRHVVPYCLKTPIPKTQFLKNSVSIHHKNCETVYILYYSIPLNTAFLRQIEFSEVFLSFNYCNEGTKQFFWFLKAKTEERLKIIFLNFAQLKDVAHFKGLFKKNIKLIIISDFWQVFFLRKSNFV